VDFFLFPRLKSIMKGARFANVWQRFCDRFLKRPFLTVSRTFINVANSVLGRMAIILKANKFNFVCIFCFVCFLLPFTNRFRHTTYPTMYRHSLCCRHYL
jgi:hypothetical protein